jgi:hypothetical protein
MGRNWRPAAWALAGYAALAVLQAWPLPRHLSTHVTGLPGGDTSVYIWNTWVFRHELMQGRSPLETSAVLALDAPVDLALHNYTIFADLVAVALQPAFGLIASFNAIYLLNVALAGWGTFLLARRVTGTALEAFAAGALFACSPFLVARSTAHYSLAAAAPLPFFLYWLDRTWSSRRLAPALATGACVAWAAVCDPYYAIYCAMLGAVFVLVRSVSARRLPAPPRTWAKRLLELAMLGLLVLIVAVVLGARTVAIGPVQVSMRSLYTPVLSLTVLAIARVAIGYSVRTAWREVPSWRLAGLGVSACAATAVLLAPLLASLADLIAAGEGLGPGVLWRSSPPGVDLVSLLVPNPGHPLAPAAWVDWLSVQPNRYEENVASLPLVAIGIVLVATTLARHRPDPLWLAVTAGFALLAIGPFVRIAGVDTYVPGPWAILRYLPVLGAARMPSRFAVVAVLGLAVLTAAALAALARRDPRRRSRVLAVASALLALELLPVPRTLYAVDVPAVYHTIGADPRPVRVLSVPAGIRDGLSSLGDFSATSQLYQTAHGKPLIGGYLSRVPAATKRAYREIPVMDALITLSENRALSLDQVERARRSAGAFLRDANIGYVVIDTYRASLELQSFAIELLRLTEVARSGSHVLYAPRQPPDAGSGGDRSAAPAN